MATEYDPDALDKTPTKEQLELDIEAQDELPELGYTQEEIDDFVGRLEKAIRRAVAGHPRDLDLSKQSHSLMPVVGHA